MGKSPPGGGRGVATSHPPVQSAQNTVRSSSAQKRAWGMRGSPMTRSEGRPSLSPVGAARGRRAERVPLLPRQGARRDGPPRCVVCAGGPVGRCAGGPVWAGGRPRNTPPNDLPLMSPEKYPHRQSCSKITCVPIPYRRSQASGDPLPFAEAAGWRLGYRMVDDPERPPAPPVHRVPPEEEVYDDLDDED